MSVPQEALNWIQKLLALDRSTRVLVLLTIADRFVDAGDIKKAIAWLDLACELEPDFFDAIGS